MSRRLGWLCVRWTNLLSMKNSPAKPNRRDFLAALAAAPLAAAACGQAPYDPSRFRRPAMSPVFLSAVSDYAADLADVIGRGMRELGVTVAGKRVLLKPNLVEYEPGAAINTHPSVIVGAAIAMRRAGAAEVVVGEGPGHQRDIEYLLTATGLADHLRENRIGFVDLNVDDVGWRELASNFSGIGRMALPASVLNADLVVSLPKLKTHHWAGMTCAMKNLFGVVPGAVYGWPKNLLHVHGLHGPIVDLVATVRAGLTIIDGIVGMEGDGPIMGTSRGFGLVAMSTDLVAADATCARVLGFDAVRLPYLATAGRFLGNLDERRIDQRGERPARFATRAIVLDQFRDWQEGNGRPWRIF
jgi:uncharacterized protein (DUF362 family)